MEPETLPQPPPGVSAPPPGEAAQRSRRWMKGIVWFGMLCVAFFIAAPFIAPLSLRAKKKPDQTQATSNARQLGMALFEFESEYGEFPNAATAKTVKAKTSTKWALGDATSNELFRQLLASGIVNSEDIFYAKAGGTRRPDGKMAEEKDAIAKGECGFALIAIKDTSGSAARPLAVCPVLPGTHKFDPKPFDGKAVVLRMDNSVQCYQIAPDGHIIPPGGGDLLDPHHPMWEGKMPDIKWPELLPVRSESGYAPWICVGVIVGIVIILPVVVHLSGRKKSLIDSELGEKV